MKIRPSPKPAFLSAKAALTACAWFGAAKLGWSLGSEHGEVILIWPATGVALAATLVFGYWMAPAIAVGAIVAHLSNGLSLPSACVMATGHALQAVFVVCLLRRTAESIDPLGRIDDAIRFLCSH